MLLLYSTIFHLQKEFPESTKNLSVVAFAFNYLGVSIFFIFTKRIVRNKKIIIIIFGRISILTQKSLRIRKHNKSNTPLILRKKFSMHQPIQKQINRRIIECDKDKILYTLL